MRRATQLRAFSLIELLLAVFILGLGVISIAAIFPAGIAQQQMAADEELGPAVAEHALNVVRSKVRAEDFGSFEQFGVFDIGNQSSGGVWRPAPGDWSWIRPAILTTNIAGSALDETGAVDIFSNYAALNSGGGTDSLEEFTGGVTPTAGGAAVLYGVPYNAARYFSPPPVAITQKERYWPMAADGQTQTDPPQYTWDIMFRRFGGKVQVAIFVYRVIAPGGGPRAYVAQSIPGSGGMPPVPYRRMTETPAQTGSWPPVIPAAWQQTAPPPIPATQIEAAGPYSNGQLGTPTVALADFPSSRNFPQHQWQLPGQWLLTNDGAVVRINVGRKISNADPALVRFGSPIPRMPAAQVFSDYESPATVQGVRALWYVPAFDSRENQLVPVYATVRDL